MSLLTRLQGCLALEAVAGLVCAGFQLAEGLVACSVLAHPQHLGGSCEP